MPKNAECLNKVIAEVESCLAEVDRLGLTRAGAILHTAIIEMKAIVQSVEALERASEAHSADGKGECQ